MGRVYPFHVTAAMGGSSSRQDLLHDREVEVARCGIAGRKRVVPAALPEALLDRDARGKMRGKDVLAIGVVHPYLISPPRCSGYSKCLLKWILTEPRHYVTIRFRRKMMELVADKQAEVSRIEPSKPLYFPVEALVAPFAKAFATFATGVESLHRCDNHVLISSRMLSGHLDTRLQTSTHCMTNRLQY